jgi:glycerophosphoryl diester phosphodiesterase
VSARRFGRSATPLVLGHRGASAHVLENTLAAFTAARAAGADGVELDVWRAKSGEVVVFHDHDLRRLAGRDDLVTELPMAALAEVELEGGHRIPTLDQVLETLGPELLVNIELKTTARDTGAALAPAVARVIARHAAAARVIVSSFNPMALGWFRTQAPHVGIGLLFHAEQALPLRGAWARQLLRPQAVHPDRRLCDPDRVARWHRAGLAINVWTVDGEREVTRLAGLGVDALITNDPAMTRELLADVAAGRVQ